jgi:DTW domain-containing protein YfiP
MRTKRLTRCTDCGLSTNLCICDTLPALTARTRIIILAHRIELGKTTNTGRLVTRMLGDHAELIQSDTPWQPSDPDSSYVLFPTDDAVPLEQVAAKIHTLIIPDGTWAQARRMARRHPSCRALNKVQLTASLRSHYTLRRSHLQNGLCTLEAAAEALRVLEDPTSADRMLQTFTQWVQRAELVRAGAHDMRAFRDAPTHPDCDIIPLCGSTTE